MSRVLAVRLDSDGDVLLTGPAIRALAATAHRVDLLVSPAGRQAAELLPGVSEVLEFDAPWSGVCPPSFDHGNTARLLVDLQRRNYDRAVVFTSFHQSPLPMALLAKWAGIEHVAADSVDYPGTLVDLRHSRPEGHEVTAAIALAEAAGGRRDGDRLAVRLPLPDVSGMIPAGGYVAVHPGAAVPARAPGPRLSRHIVEALLAAGRQVVVTGGPGERASAGVIAGARATNLAGRTGFAELAAVLAAAECVVVGNTGPAHLAAAVGTPVVSLFAPVVPASRWAPYGVPTVLLGDQQAPCRGTRARECPVPAHPCLDRIDPLAVVTAVDRLTGMGVAA